MSLYDNASLIMYPSGYKEGTLYSQKPTDGTGDLTFTRASTKTRINESGVRETVATDVPSIDFSNGCGQLLLEPQRTNLYLNSDTMATQNVTTTATSYTVSFEGTGTITFSGSYVGSLVGAGAGWENRVSLTFTATAGTLTSTISGTVTSGQCEAGAFQTSYIPSLGATVTRVGDISRTTGISSVIGQAEGVLYAKIASFTNTSPINASINISDGTSGNQIAMWYGTTLNQFKILIRQSGNKLFHVTTLTDATQFIKVAVLYKSGGSKVYINGSFINSTTLTFAFTNALSSVDFYGVGLGNSNFNGKLQELQLYPTALSHSELVELTTI